MGRGRSDGLSCPMGTYGATVAQLRLSRELRWPSLFIPTSISLGLGHQGKGVTLSKAVLPAEVGGAENCLLTALPTDEVESMLQLGHK